MRNFLGPVVHSFVSLIKLLRRQLIQYIPSPLLYTVSLLFFDDFFSHYFSTKITVFVIFNS